jgi:hypothetical protein
MNSGDARQSINWSLKAEVVTDADFEGYASIVLHGGKQNLRMNIKWACQSSRRLFIIGLSHVRTRNQI